MDRGAWRALVRGVAEESDRTKQLNNNNNKKHGFVVVVHKEWPPVPRVIFYF